MYAFPEECLVRTELPGDWGHGEVDTSAALRAAAHLVCGHLIPIGSAGTSMPHFGVAMEHGVPAILELDSLSIGPASVTVRPPDTAEHMARRLAEEIRDRAIVLAPIPARDPEQNGSTVLPF